MPNLKGNRGLSVLCGLVLVGCSSSGTNPDAATGGSDAGTNPTGGTGGSAGTGGAAGGAGTGGAGTVGSAGTDGGAVTGGTAGSSIDGGAPDAAIDAGPTALVLETVRTYAFHDLTAMSARLESWPALSGNGQVVAFATGGVSPTEILVNTVNADGTGMKQVDHYAPRCYCDGWIDISADGQTVISSDSVQIRLSKGGVVTPVVTLDSNEIWDMRVSADGGKVFFLLRRDAGTIPATTRLERGVWVVNADGGGLKQLTGATLVAAAIGTTADKVFPFAGCGRAMDVSTDGNRIAFVTAVAGVETIFGVNGDGGGLHKLLESTGGYKLVNKIGLSGNGQTVGFHVFVGDGMIELGAIGFDGSNRRKLASEPPAQLAGCEGNMRLTDDGSKLYVSEPSYVYSTDGSGVLQLSTDAYRPAGGFPLKDGTPGGTMNGTGTRFAYRNPDDANAAQVMLLELDPTSLGAAPTLASPTFTPGTVTIDGLKDATAVVHAAGMGLQRVGVVFYSSGLPDIIDRGNGVNMRDDGMGGDPTANDGTFTGHGFAGYNTPLPGPKNLRFTAESKVGNLRQATVLETKGVVVQ